eukprot:sb/3468659/
MKLIVTPPPPGGWGTMLVFYLLLVVSTSLVNAASDDLKCVMRLSGTNTEIGTIVISSIKRRSFKVSLHSDAITDGKHGLHIHQYGVGDGFNCGTTGGHFNPLGSKHGKLNSEDSHIGDLGNVDAINGTIDAKIWATRTKWTGKRGIVGRSLVLHAGEDDLGEGGDIGTLCDVIQVCVNTGLVWKLDLCEFAACELQSVLICDDSSSTSPKPHRYRGHPLTGVVPLGLGDAVTLTTRARSTRKRSLPSGLSCE